MQRMILLLKQMCSPLKAFVNMNSSDKIIVITNNSLWNDIQSTFSTNYPFLKIEFTDSEKGIKKNRRFKIDADSCINNITKLNEPCIIDIDGNRSISQLALDFKNMLGIEVEVLRKSGNVWNLISLTGSWTLESQNEAGKFISSQMHDTL